MKPLALALALQPEAFGLILEVLTKGFDLGLELET